MYDLQKVKKKGHQKACLETDSCQITWGGGGAAGRDDGSKLGAPSAWQNLRPRIWHEKR